MKNSLKVSSTILLGLSLILPLTARAYDYTQKFAGTTTGSGTVQLGLPIYTGFPAVVSKYNQ